MNENERDTHFQEFAELLRRDLSEIIDEPLVHSSANFEDFERKITRLKQILAQRGYDLVYHALDTSGVYLHSEPLEPEYIADTDEIIKYVSDLTEWPKP